MKKLLLSIFTIACALTSYATEQGDTTVMSLNDIIAMETQSKADYENVNRQRDIWSHTPFLHIRYNKTHFSFDDLPPTLPQL